MRVICTDIVGVGSMISICAVYTEIWVLGLILARILLHFCVFFMTSPYPLPGLSITRTGLPWLILPISFVDRWVYDVLSADMLWQKYISTTFNILKIDLNLT